MYTTLAVRDAIDAMIAKKGSSTTFKNARYYQEGGRLGSTLYIYGTDDGKDAVNDLDGRSNRSIPGLSFADGAVDYASLIERAVDMTRVDLMVTHSLGAAAGCVLSVKWGIPCLALAPYRLVHGSDCEDYHRHKQGFYPSFGLIKQLIVTGDLWPTLPWWNERMPWWCAETYKRRAPWRTYLTPWRLHHLRTYQDTFKDLCVQWEHRTAPGDRSHEQPH